ncbi:MAG TPA: hypothetical protein VGJ45_09275 [Pseudonocardiaceae bacterium]
MRYGQEAANERIDRALADGATTLDLSDLHLTEVPPRVAELGDLAVLKLAENRIEDLPAWLADLTELTELQLARTRLRTLPAELTRLSKLRRIDLYRNYFDEYANLSDRLTRTPPRHEIECHQSGEMVSVAELLYGLTPSERDSTQVTTQQLTRALERLEARVEDQSDYAQRMFLRLQQLLQTQQEARCPSVFAVVPADRRRLTGSAYEIHLYCEEPGSWHRLAEGSGVYPVTQPHEWFVKLGPHLQRLISVLKHAAPLAGPVLGVAFGVLNEQLKADVELMKELAGQSPKDLPSSRKIDGAMPTDGGAELHAANDADFRALRSMLVKLDPAETWGGLSRYTTPEGLTLYLCAEHLANYRRPTSRNTSTVVEVRP